MKYIEKQTTVGELKIGDEFEFMGSVRPWRVVGFLSEEHPRVQVRHLNGKGIDSWMRKDRKCFKLRYS